MEQWAPIEGIRNYEVSDLGHVRNVNTLRHLGIYDNGSGVMQVVMKENGKAICRAVHKLVAEAFLDMPPEGYVPIHIDDDWTNAAASNLEWKPRWFARKRTAQNKRTVPTDNRPILVVEKEEVYDNALECAKAIGGLEDLVLITARNRHGGSYLGLHFEFYYD